MAGRVLFWTALPVALPQALLIRMRTPASAAAEGSPHGEFGTGERLSLIGIGDSIIAGVGVARTEHAVPARVAAGLAETTGRCVSWKAVGQSGLNAAQILERLVPRIPDEPADCFVVSVGVNDVTAPTSTRRWRRGLGDLLDALRNHSPRAVIALLGLPPMQYFPLLPRPLRDLMGLRARTLDAIGMDVCVSRQGVIHLPYRRALRPEEFAPDGYHPGEGACDEVGRAVAERISGMLPDPGVAAPGAR